MSLTVKQYMNQYYRGYTYGVSTSSRDGHSANELNTADMKAVRASLRDLEDYDYDSGDGEELVKKVSAFVETYNNMLDSAGGLESEDADRYTGRIKKLTRGQQSVLADIGVSIKSSGRLEIDKDTLEGTSRRRVEKVFGGENDYNTKLQRYVKQLDRAIRVSGAGQEKKSADKAEGETDGTETSEEGTSAIESLAAQQQSAEELFEQLNDSINNAGTVNYNV